MLNLLQTSISGLKATRNISGDSVSPKTLRLILMGGVVHSFALTEAESLEYPSMI